MEQRQNPYAPPAATTTHPEVGGAPPAGGHPGSEFRSARTLGTVAAIFVGIGTLSQLPRVGADLFFLAKIDSIKGGGLSPAVVQSTVTTFERVMGAHLVIWWVTLIGGAIALPMFFYRTTANLRAITETPPRFGPGLAAGGFFIPFANLVLPYSAGSEIWKHSAPADTSRWRTSWVGIWWLSYLVGGALGRVAEKFADDIATVKTALTMDVVSALLIIVAGSAAIQMVRGISWRQEQRWVELRSSSAPSGFDAPIA